MKKRNKSLHILRDLPYGENEAQKMDLYLAEEGRGPVLLYLHGGGLTGGDKGKAIRFFEYLASCGISTISANYRLYPEADYPDFIHDAAAATAWMLEHYAQYGTPTSFFVGGSSAGGYLSQMLLFDPSFLAQVGHNCREIDGFILDAGQPTSHFNVLKMQGVDPRRVIVDETAPLYHVKGDQPYSPMLILVSDNDMENRYEQTMLLASTLKHFGYEGLYRVKIMHGKHIAYVYETDDEGRNVFGHLVSKYIYELQAKQRDATPTIQEDGK